MLYLFNVFNIELFTENCNVIYAKLRIKIYFTELRAYSSKKWISISILIKNSLKEQFSTLMLIIHKLYSYLKL
jgi:hypothetical protein